MWCKWRIRRKFHEIPLGIFYFPQSFSRMLNLNVMLQQFYEHNSNNKLILLAKTLVMMMIEYFLTSINLFVIMVLFSINPICTITLQLISNMIATQEGKMLQHRWMQWNKLLSDIRTEHFHRNYGALNWLIKHAPERVCKNYENRLTVHFI